MEVPKVTQLASGRAGIQIQVAQTPHPTGSLSFTGCLLAHCAQSLPYTWEGINETQTTQPIHAFKFGKQIITRINWEMKTKFMFLVYCIVLQ